jgi:hypothetical protein
MNPFSRTAILLLLCSCLKSYSQTADTVCGPYDCCRPDGQAPLGVMTDHVHGKGQWMVSYSYMNTMLSGNRSGQYNMSDDNVFQNYYAAPQKMTMQMHMLMVMYGISENLSVMVMGNYNINTMSMNMDPTMMMHMGGISAMPMTMSTATSGLGDTKVTALYRLADKQNARVILGLGLSLPTGSIEQKSISVVGDTVKSSYMMQTGTGSVGLIPSVSYIAQSNSISWGLSANACIQTGANSEGYQWGNQFTGTGWVAYKLFNFVSASVRLEAGSTGSISGFDRDIAVFSANDPTANTANYGGTHATAFAGLNFYVPGGRCKNFRIAFEYGMPFYQDLNGTQMPLTSSLNGGIRYNF